MEIDTLDTLTDDIANRFIPGVRFFPSDAELLAYLNLYKAHPEEFKQTNIIPVFDDMIDKINPEDVRDQCRLHNSHWACIFLAYKRLIPPDGQYAISRTHNRLIKCNENILKGIVSKVMVLGGPFEVNWIPWRIEEIESNDDIGNPTLEYFVCYRAYDEDKESLLPLPTFSLSTNTLTAAIIEGMGEEWIESK